MSGRSRRLWERARGLLLAVTRGVWRGASARLRDLFELRRLFSVDAPSSFRRLAELFEAFREGGVAVVTAGRSGQPAASTLVTPDGDLVSRLTPEVLLEPALWRRHQQEVLRRVEPLTRVSAMVRGLDGLLTVGSVVLGAYCLGSVGAVATGGLDALAARAAELWVEIRWPVFAGALAGGTRYVLRQWLRSQVEKLLS